jgi:hypothetical protein
MIGSTGLLSGLAGKVLLALGMGAAGVTATGAAGALPGPAQHAVAGVVNAVSPLHIPTGDGTGGAGGTFAAALHGGQTPAGVRTSVGGTGTATAGAQGSTAEESSATASTSTAAKVSPNLAGLSPALPSLPSLPVSFPGAGSLPAGVPTCVTSIVDPSTGHLLVPPAQLSAAVLACAKSLVPTGSLPGPVASCLTSVLGSLQGLVGGGVPTGVPNVDVRSCVPVDVSTCVSSVVGAVGANPMALLGNVGNLGTLTGLSGLLGQVGGLGGLADLARLPGCVPVDPGACVSSILGSVGAGVPNGGVPKIDLSACLPTGLVGGLPIGS